MTARQGAQPKTGSGTKREKERKIAKPKTEAQDLAKPEILEEPETAVQDTLEPDEVEEFRQETAVLTTELAGAPLVAMVGPDRLKGMLDELRAKDKIMTDDGAEIDFDPETKEYFIHAYEAAHPIIERALNSMSEMARFLHEVRAELKPKKLFYTWLAFTGIPTRTAHNNLRAYEKYQDKLVEYAFLGIRKLLITSRLPDCIDYVEKNLDSIAKKSVAELEEEVKALRERRRSKATGRGRKPVRMEVGRYLLRPSLDGKRLTIEGLSKKKRAELIEAIKVLLLQEDE